MQMFVICNFGGLVNSQFEELSDTLYECDWYAFPHELQKNMPVIMLVTQKPVLRGSENLPCLREGFSEVSLFLRYLMYFLTKILLQFIEHIIFILFSGS